MYVACGTTSLCKLAATSETVKCWWQFFRMHHLSDMQIIILYHPVVLFWWIGEHIDYCGYAVLPVAIEQDIVIAIAFNNDGLLRLADTDQRYK